mgnify:CR=1 FL=1
MTVRRPTEYESCPYSASDVTAETTCVGELKSCTVEALILHGDGGRPLRVTLSAGVAEAAFSDTPETLMHLADKALYQAKQQGRNRVVVADDCWHRSLAPLMAEVRERMGVRAAVVSLGGTVNAEYRYLFNALRVHIPASQLEALRDSVLRLETLDDTSQIGRLLAAK